MTMPAAKTLVFAATYNERGNIEGLCNAVLALRENYDLLIVDDKSPDGTGDVLDRLAAAEERLRVVHRPTKMGLGSAHKLAMQYAIHNGYETLITKDADFSHDPGDIPRLETILPRIIDNFQVYLRELRIEDLQGSAGLYRLREELLTRVSVAAAPAKVHDVLFKEMLIQ